jgi:acyl-phosphate glycerol 3-phosphate acyltransferase
MSVRSEHSGRAPRRYDARVSLSFIPILVLSYLIGALPLGFWYARFRGLEPRRASVSNLGLENAMRVMGPEVAVASFVLDLLKGVLAVAVAAPFEGNEPALLAGLTGYLGHLYPPAFLFPRAYPIRGRGNVVLLGALAGLTIYAGFPFWLSTLPVLVWAGALAYSRYASLATLAGVGVLAIIVILAPVDAWGRFSVLLLVAAVAWRFKENIGRMLDRTEPRLGELRSVSGERRDQVVAAFIIHALTIDDFWKTNRFAWLKPLYERGWVSYDQLKFMGRFVRPFKIGELRGISTADGKEIRCYLLSAPFLPEMFKDDPALAVRRAIQGARLAHELGASVYGLGAFWGTVGKKGLEVQEAVPEICVTNGGAYTAGSIRAAVPQILEHFRSQGRDLKTVTAAVVGANGVVAFGMARMIAPEVGRVILIGRDLERLERSKQTIARAFPDTQFVTSIDAHDCITADLIFSATSDPNPVIFAKDVKPGAWIYDEGRPMDVDAGVFDVPGVRIIPGGVVRPPGVMFDPNGWAIFRLGFGSGNVPACLAETLIIAANDAFERQSLGDVTKTEHINYFVAEAARLGFRVLEDTEDGPPPPTKTSPSQPMLN